jgi:hypothetical protein
MVQISDNPRFDFQRKVDEESVVIVIDRTEKYVLLQLKVYNFLNEEVITDIPVKSVNLKADNSTYVNSQGIPTNVEEEYFMGEYDFFCLLLTQPVVINDLITAKIQWADAIGRFD